MGWAFAGGYQAALRALRPELPHDSMVALCVTEEAGNRPRDIRTTITPQAPLPGAGYDCYVKPFRTLEDVHVTLAVLSYVLREARARGWPGALREQLVALLSLLLLLAPEDASAASTHVALAGALRWAGPRAGTARSPSNGPPPSMTRRRSAGGGMRPCCG